MVRTEVTWAGGCQDVVEGRSCVAEGETIVISMPSAARCDRATSRARRAMLGACWQILWRCQGEEAHGRATGERSPRRPSRRARVQAARTTGSEWPSELLLTASGGCGLVRKFVRITLRALAATVPLGPRPSVAKLSPMAAHFWQFFSCHTPSRHTLAYINPPCPPSQPTSLPPTPLLSPTTYAYTHLSTT